MNYQQHELVQGGAEWLAFRSRSFGASDAAAILGLSKYKSRAELLREKATGLTPDVDEATQGRFDRGHEIEAIARAFAAQHSGNEFYPAVLSREVDGLPLSASLDGITMDDSMTWECKTSNLNLRESLARGVIPAEYEPQLEQGLLISGAQWCLFTISDGTEVGTVHAVYTSKPGLRATIIAGWKQFSVDLAAYVPEAPTAVVLAAPVESLPAVSVRMDGAIAVIDNLDVFGERLRNFVERIDRAPETDQAFADTEAAVKELKRAEEALEAAEANALAQIDPVETMRRTVADLSNLARTTRLLLEKIVKVRKDEIRVQVAAEARTAYCAHLSQMNATLAVSVLESPSFTADVAAAIKGKRSLDSLKADVAQVVANYKIASNADADRHRTNTAIFKDANRAPLFPDFVMLVRSKQPEDLANLVQARIADADKAEQDRERIRNEERARLQAEAPVVMAQTQPAGPGQIQSQPSLSASNDPQPQAPETTAAVAVSDEAHIPQVAAARPGATMKLGDINARIAPLTISGDGLEKLGFKPVGVEKSAKLYSEAQFNDICRAMGRVLKAAMEAPAMKEAA